MKYKTIPKLTPEQVEASLERDDPNELSASVLAAVLYWNEAGAAEALCLRLAEHDDPNVRGNAVLGLGHLARRFSSLSPEAVARIEAARSDDADYVRGQAEAAWDDVSVFVRHRPPPPESAT